MSSSGSSGAENAVVLAKSTKKLKRGTKLGRTLRKMYSCGKADRMCEKRDIVVCYAVLLLRAHRSSRASAAGDNVCVRYRTRRDADTRRGPGVLLRARARYIMPLLLYLCKSIFSMPMHV